MSSQLPLAVGHVRNAVWQLMSNDHDEGLALGLEALEVEALLTLDGLDPEVPTLEPDPIASLIAARALLDGAPDEVPPAAWAALQALIAKLS
jgi:hypothetical protein